MTASVDGTPAAQTSEKRSRGVSTLVYFIRAKTLRMVKIGRTNNLDQRLWALRTGSPDELELEAVIPADDDAEFVERWVHGKFATQRSHGEWFHPSDELDAFIIREAMTQEQHAQWLCDRMLDRIDKIERAA